ncbi:hypothetical protein G9272_17860 [Streptomyces asoensis]|uniref:Lipoprotein n=1 Tax=Streptomyces asoensis TaxID=249586 RepID=A0A6M4WMZ4_9ACTN|nr:hypothetical protein [Streptomyces asoensis]QJT01950.1 hypothetical protein G9272_17860 [Streptomyces asoensis]
MGSMKITLCAGIAVVAAVLVPTAYASGEGSGDKGGSVSITPSTPAPGAEVTLKVSGCGGRTATAASDAFVADAQLADAQLADAQLAGAAGTLVGDTRVRSSIGTGTYDVQITCVDFKVKGHIKVVASSSAESSERSESSDFESSEPYGPSTPASPVAPVRAGGGGTAPLAPLAAVDEAQVEGHGPGTVQTVVGMVLAGVAAAAVAFRGVHRRRRAD